MHELILSIEALEDAAGWRGSWSLDGNQVGQSIRVDGAQAEAMRSLSQGFLELFEQKHPHGHSLRPIVESPSLAATGAFLHEQWFKPVRDRLQTGLQHRGASLLIRSRDPFILNLPWELVELSPDLPIGCDPDWRLRRTCLDRLDGPADLAPGPLRIQFLAAAPTDQQQLDFEKEEEAILRATGRIQNAVMLPIADSGGLEELTDLVAEHHPHVVQGTEHYKNGLIIYSLGNFTFVQNGNPWTRLGAAATITISNGRLAGVGFVPIRAHFKPQVITDLRVKKSVLQRISDLSGKLSD